MSQQYQNRQQRRAAERSARKQQSNSKTDLLPPLTSVNDQTVNFDQKLTDSNNASTPLSPAGPFLNPITQTLQTEPWIPPQVNGNQTLPQEAQTSGSESGGNELPIGLQPLKPKEQKLADDLSGWYYLLGTGTSFASPFGGKAIILQAPILSESHVRMARHIPAYYAWLEKIVAYNDFVPIVTTHLAVTAAIMTHHDMVPEAAKAHFKMLGSEVTQKVQLLEAMENAANNGTQGTPYAVPSMAM